MLGSERLFQGTSYSLLPVVTVFLENRLLVKREERGGEEEKSNNGCHGREVGVGIKFGGVSICAFEFFVLERVINISGKAYASCTRNCVLCWCAHGRRDARACLVCRVRFACVCVFLFAYLLQNIFPDLRVLGMRVQNLLADINSGYVPSRLQVVEGQLVSNRWVAFLHKTPRVLRGGGGGSVCVWWRCTSTRVPGGVHTS